MNEKLKHNPLLDLNKIKSVAKMLLVSGTITPIDQTDAMLMNLSVCPSCRLHDRGCRGVERLDKPAEVSVGVSIVNIRAELQEVNPGLEEMKSTAKLLAAEHVRNESDCKPQYS